MYEATDAPAPTSTSGIWGRVAPVFSGELGVLLLVVLNALDAFSTGIGLMISEPFSEPGYLGELNPALRWLMLTLGVEVALSLKIIVFSLALVVVLWAHSFLTIVRYRVYLAATLHFWVAVYGYVVVSNFGDSAKILGFSSAVLTKIPL